MSNVFKVQIPPKHSPEKKKTKPDPFGSDIFADDLAPKKKKKKVKVETKNLPALLESSSVEPAKKGKLSKTDVNNLRTLFGERAEDMLQLIESNDRDGAITMLYKQLLSMTVDIIPFAENLVRSTKGYRGVYQVNALVSQCREILVDIQSMQDRSKMGATLVERHIRPAFLDIAMQIVQSNHNLTMSLLALVDGSKQDKVRDLFQANQQTLARYIQDQYVAVQDSVMRGLS